MIRKSVITTFIVLLVVLWYKTDTSFQEFVKSSVGRSGEASTLTRIFGTKTVIQFEEPAVISSADIVEETNKERIAAGLAPLSINTQLSVSAEYKVDDMIENQYFDHDSPKGETVSDLGERAGYSYVIMGENLALGDFEDARDLVAAWMDSPGHKANILSTKYQNIGVSVKRAFFEGQEVWFAVQHFGTARNACPSINNSLKKDIDMLNESLQAQEGELRVLKDKLQKQGASSQPWFQSEVQHFNALVDTYNQMLGESRAKIQIYNEEVKVFNRCIATFQ